jgi:hypothetical protein
MSLQHAVSGAKVTLRPSVCAVRGRELRGEQKPAVPEGDSTFKRTR